MLNFINNSALQVYRYATAFIVVASPLFFIPGTSLAPELTYYVVIMGVAFLALFAYIITALLSKAWHPISRLEFIGYGIFSASVLLSSVFTNSPKVILFGSDINVFSSVSLLVLPVIIYLVRTLPTLLRNRLKVILLIEIVVSALLFVVSYMFTGNIKVGLLAIFGGFTSPLSFSLYLGLFVIGGVALLRRDTYARHHKIAIGMTMLIVSALALVFVTQGDVRPNVQSSFIVAKDVLIENGVFGIGAGDFTRAWQLYRPKAVINTQFFDVEFVQASGTLTTFLSTIGIVGTLALIFLVVVALFSSYRIWKREDNKDERLMLGVLLVAQAYFFLLAWLVPLSYSLLVLWMVLLGFAFGRVKTDEHSPSKRAMILFIPIFLLMTVNGFLLIKKVESVRHFALAQKSASIGNFAETEKYLVQAIADYQMDTYYRALSELAITQAQGVVSRGGENQEEMKNEYLLYAKKAVDQSISSISVAPYNYQNYVTNGRAYELALPFDKDNAYQRAKDAYGKAIKLYPNNPYLYLMQARLSASVGEKVSVRESLNEALGKKQNFTDALYLMSQLSASEQNVDEAIKYAVSAVQSSPNDPNVWVQAGLLFYGKKDYQDAVIALQKAFSLDQSNGTIAYFLALSLRDGGRPDLAKTIGEELLKQNPNNTDVNSLLKSLDVRPASVAPVKK